MKTEATVEMKGAFGLVLSTLMLSAAASAAVAHDAPDFDHSHAFQRSEFGVWRQGHSVNGKQGDIIIWSPQPYSGYQMTPPVRFARPQPITVAPAGAAAKRGIAPLSAAGTGTRSRPPR